MAKVEKPKWSLSQDYSIGMKAYELALKYRKNLEPRVPSGFFDGMKEDLDRLGSIGKESITTRAGVKGFSGTQEEALKQGINWCSRVREALKRGRAKEDVQKAAGVGAKFSRNSVYAVTAAMNAIFNAYDKYRQAFLDCGILPEDMDKGKTIISALETADEEQERKKAKTKETTASRNALRVRIEAAVDRLIGAANTAFMDKPDILKLFADLVPGGGRKNKEAEEEAPAQKV
ncbi:MAG: hypothetical protein ACE14Q_09515 [Acidobacteriota bacterium]